TQTTVTQHARASLRELPGPVDCPETVGGLTQTRRYPSSADRSPTCALHLSLRTCRPIPDCTYAALSDSRPLSRSLPESLEPFSRTREPSPRCSFCPSRRAPALAGLRLSSARVGDTRAEPLLSQ